MKSFDFLDKILRIRKKSTNFAREISALDYCDFHTAL